MTKRVFGCTAGLVFVVCAWLAAQDPARLTARELFYAASTRNPATPPRPAAPSPPGKASTPAKAATTTTPPTASAANNAPASTAGRPTVEPASQGTVTRVDYTPLGLRYGILRKNAAGQYGEVEVDTTFRSGDGIRVSVESNDDAYLYIVNKGSSGTWSLLFPSSEIENGNNRVQAHRRIREVPARGQFTFVDQPGEERLFVVLSRQTEPDLENLIYSLGKPESAPGRPEPSKVLSVQASINDGVVGRIRNTVIARDLVFEKVDDQVSDRKEKAAYVVNATGGASGRVVADLTLSHR